MIAISVVVESATHVRPRLSPSHHTVRVTNFMGNDVIFRVNV